MDSANNLSHNFALIALLKTLHEKGHDSWSAFSQLALAIIEDNQNLEGFGLAFYSTYKVNLPPEVAYTILARLKKSQYIQYTRREGPYSLSDKGRKKAEEALKSVASFRTEFNLLVVDLREFLEEKNIHIDHLDKELIKFIDANLAFTSDVVSGVKGIAERNNRAEIAAYISCLEIRNSALFRVLQNIFFGRLYLQTFNTQIPIEKKAKFSDLEIFIDTNIIFDLIGLGSEKQASSLRSLLAALQKDSKISIKVLDTTLTEAKRTLTAASAPKIYFDYYQVDSLNWKLKKLGYDSSSIAIVVENLNDDLASLGVKEETSTSEPSDVHLKKVRSLSERYGQKKSENAIDHDAGVLTYLSVVRKGHHSALLEKSRALFLTTDKALVFEAKESAKHDGGFPLSISPVELTCLIWLKDMSQKELLEATLRQALMVYAREKMLDSKLWEEFIQRLTDAKSQGKIGNEELALIVNSEQTKALLFEEGEPALEQVLDDKYIGRLKRQDKINRQKFAETESHVERIERKKSRIAHYLGVTVYSLISIILSILVCILLLWVINETALNNVADSLAFVPILILVFVLNVGKPLNIVHIINFRNKVITYFETKIENFLKKIFY